MTSATPSPRGLAAPLRFAVALFGAFVVLLLGACTTLMQPPRTGASAPPAAVTLAEAERGYARVLHRHVNDAGEVAFQALQQDSSTAGLPALEVYVGAIATTSLDAAAATPEGRLAHMINAYNALSMYNVIASGIPRSHEGLFDKIRFFVLHEFDVGGTRRSLRSFENEVIRKAGEPRVHFALNCSAVACPQLPRVPFTGEGLDQELEREAHRFFVRPLNLRVDEPTNTVWVSEILQFYTEDFVPAHAPTLIDYVQRYTSVRLPPNGKVGYIPYDWRIANSQQMQ